LFLRRRSRTPSVSDEALRKYRQAGAVTREARGFAVSHAKAGMSALSLAEAVEGLIRSRGASCAFPVNIGVNSVAAHYTPSRTDDTVLRVGDVVKIDLGAHVDGYPADTSVTVELGTRNNQRLISCAEEALRMAIEMVAPGTTTSAIGEAVERAIRSAGYRPVENLTGHSMERFNLHAGLSVPSVKTRESHTVEEGMVIAIEPFSTTGKGKVNGVSRGNIYRVVRDRRAPSEVSAMFAKILSRFGSLPFASRWCDDLHPEAQTLLSKMLRMGMVMNYPVLVEVADGFVAQAEHSVLVTKDGCIVLT
jgi:methionyl aminopeptidase